MHILETGDIPVNPPWFYDVASAPGWLDWLGLAVAVAGFWIAIVQIKAAKKESRLAKEQSEKAATESSKATRALATAQKHLSERTLMAVVPQIQAVVTDLSYSLPASDKEVTQRTLLRFGLLARETSGVLDGFATDHNDLSARLVKAAEKATKTKGQIMAAEDPDIVALAKGVASDIEKLSQELSGLVSTLRNTIEGEAHV